MPKPGGYEQMGGSDADRGGGEGGGGRMYDDNLPESPMSFEEIERPPLRHIDKYAKPECPCLSQRYTIALMACLGFIISFGMRCNMGMAKLQLEHHVSNTDLIIFNWTLPKKEERASGDEAHIAFIKSITGNDNKCYPCFLLSVGFEG
jgi:hypothetical protein